METCCYINISFNQASFAQILALEMSVFVKATSNSEIAQKFLTEFFSPLPQYLPMAANSLDMHWYQLLMVQISIEEVAKVVFFATPLKEVGLDSIPAIVW